MSQSESNPRTVRGHARQGPPIRLDPVSTPQVELCNGGRRQTVEGQRASRLIQGPGRGNNMDYVDSRDGHTKEGMFGRNVKMCANHFAVKRLEKWTLFHYNVEFEPDVEEFGQRRGLLKAHHGILPANTFDGASLLTSRKIDEKLLILKSTRRRDQAEILIKLTLVGQVEPTDPMYLQFYGIMARKCLQLLKLALLGRNYYDPKMSIAVPSYRLQIWPGFLTSMRQHESGLFYCVQSLHKIIRTESVYDQLRSKRMEVMNSHGGNMDRVKEAVKADLVGTIVLTLYNNKTYRIDDIAWSEKPASTFDQKGVPTSYNDYYLKRYDIKIVQSNQPLLISLPTKRDLHRGQTHAIKLIPELCYVTGLSEAMRQNFQLMRELGQHLFQAPDKKAATACGFIDRIRFTPEVRKELEEWGLEINANMVQLNGRLLPPEQIVFKDQRTDAPKQVEASAQGDFTLAFRSCRLTRASPLKTWICIVPGREVQQVDNLIQTMQTVSRPLGFEIKWPIETVQLQNTQIDSYIKAIDKAMNHFKADLQMIFTILPNNKIELYSAIKRRCYVELGVPSQCFMARNVQNKGLMSIATKLVVQMNCKLGGEAWQVSIPLKKTMIVGFDVYHGSPGGKGSVGAMVATLSQSYGKYYSTVTLFSTNEEVTSNMGQELLKCIKAWQMANGGELPERIMFFRDGVGDGQLQFVFESELGAIKKMLKSTYSKAGFETKLTFIVVNRRINLRLFKREQNDHYSNPPPGIVVDTVVTLPERYDFYLIAQSVRQGTVSPSSYNVLFDQSGLDADKIQRLTFKLCHLYFNFSGTVAVPAPCQYAHKLAHLTGMSTKMGNNEKLSHTLYFL